MIYHCDRIGENTYVWYCPDCFKELDTTDQEFLKYVMKTGDIPYCFDCERVRMNERPEFFKDYWLYNWSFVWPRDNTLVDVITFGDDKLIENHLTIRLDSFPGKSLFIKLMGLDACSVMPYFNSKAQTGEKSEQ